MNADMGYLAPLFKAAEDLTHDHDPDKVSFGLGYPAADSPLAADDRPLKGHKVSTVVISSVAAALDHIITLQHLVAKVGIVTNAAPWTLLRGAAEPLSLAIWVLDGGSRQMRQTRALRVWHRDLKDRGAWERDSGNVAVAPAKSGEVRAAEIVKLANNLGIPSHEFKKDLQFSRLIEYAGDAINGTGKVSLAHWRAASGFAHGRYWSVVRLSDPVPQRLLSDGVEFSMTLDERKHAEFANDVQMFLERAVDMYAAAADGTQYTP